MYNHPTDVVVREQDAPFLEEGFLADDFIDELEDFADRGPGRHIQHALRQFIDLAAELLFNAI
ncbi:MAG TPA: hypothetical protein VHM93_12395 [Candidatus Acidoferrum sp.]|jgi:hypothetical protein|nr:hypothetical protein [Candidatus Acidoferrum sp.]